MRKARDTSVLLALAAVCAVAGANAAHASRPLQQDPGDGLEELAAGGSAQARLSRDEVKAAAEAVAARVPATIEAYRQREATIASIAAKVRPAVVAIVMNDKERHGAGSGTIISSDGWVLTAAHVCMKPGVPVTVILADGTELKGVSAGQHMDTNQDIGLIKIDTGGKQLPYLDLGNASALSVGDPILVFGHPLGPEMKPWRPPPLRVGHMLALDGDVLVMDATVTPGDSGGPVVDLKGKIVGVTSVATMRPDVNAAISSDFARSKIEALKADVATGQALANGGDLTQVWVNPSEGFAPLANMSQRARVEKEHELFAPLIFDMTTSVVTVLVDAREAALGIVVDEAGHVLTKASEVGMGLRVVQVVMPDGSMVPAKRIAQDEKLDLMLLDTGTTDNTPLAFSDATAGLGQVIVSMGKSMAPAAVGYQSLEAYDAGASDQACRTLIGVALRTATAQDHLPSPGVVITKLMDGSGAKEAGLQEGDALLAVDGVPFTSPDSPAGVLRQRAPGESVQVDYMRAGVRKQATVRLQRPMFEYGPGNVGAEVSRRATGFGTVIQHDGMVAAHEMGAPITDSQGRVIGVNIARAERCKTYALPASVVKPAIERLLQAAAEGKSAEPADLRKSVTPIAFQQHGRAVLPARLATISGPTISLGGEDDLQAIQGFASIEDGAAWVLEIPAAGRYEFTLDAQGALGGRVDLFVGQELFTVAVPSGRMGTAFDELRAGEAIFDDAGLVIVRVQPLDRPHGPVMALREVRAARMEVVHMVDQVLPFMRLKDKDRFYRDLEREDQRSRARKANEEAQKKLQEDAEKPAKEPGA